jgi:hypothetical protein
MSFCGQKKDCESECRVECSKAKGGCPIRKFFYGLWLLLKGVIIVISKAVDMVIRLIGGFVVLVIVICVTVAIVSSMGYKTAIRSSVFSGMNKGLNCSENTSSTFKGKDKKMKVKTYSMVCKDGDGKVIYQNNVVKEGLVENDD